MGMSGKSASDFGKIIVSHVGTLRIDHLPLQLVYSGQYKNFLQSKQCKITLTKKELVEFTNLSWRTSSLKKTLQTQKIICLNFLHVVTVVSRTAQCYKWPNLKAWQLSIHLTCILVDRDWRVTVTYVRNHCVYVVKTRGESCFRRW